MSSQQLSIEDRLRRSSRTKASAEERETALETFQEPHYKSVEATGDDRRHRDTEDIRRRHGIAPWDSEPFLEKARRKGYDSVLPDLIEHTHSAPPSRSAGGTDWLARGKPGHGKSTLANYLATRFMEVNREVVNWRGSPSRSEWLPLAPWATLLLPEDVEVDPRLVPTEKGGRPVSIRVEDLERFVRDVRYYSDPLDILQNHQQAGQFHVIYPDPNLSGAQEIYEHTPTKSYDEPSRGQLFHEEDPAPHFWFAFLLAKVAHIESAEFTTVVLDEIGDICPQDASKDQFGSFQKIKLLRDLWIDLRKFGVTVGMFCHSEVDVHQLIRHKVRWRIQMPGTSNPTSPSKVVGFEEIPMTTDRTSGWDIGKALCYTESNFDEFGWGDMKASSEGYKLKINLGRGSDR